jgi:transcriptional regulator with XRE-family HTH domain
MAREPESIADRRRALGERLTTFRLAADLTQGQLGKAAICDRSTVAHIESGRSRADERFWRIADDACHAGGALLAGFHELQPVKAEHERQQRETELADIRAKAATLRWADASLPATRTVGWLSSSLDIEQLRREVDDALGEGALSAASLEEWELTVARHGRATRDRPPALLCSTSQRTLPS